MNAALQYGYVKHLYQRQKETSLTLCYADIFDCQTEIN